MRSGKTRRQRKYRRAIVRYDAHEARYEMPPRRVALNATCNVVRPQGALVTVRLTVAAWLAEELLLGAIPFWSTADIVNM